MMSSNQGWECPKCGNVYAPLVTECLNCNNKVVTPSPFKGVLMC